MRFLFVNQFYPPDVAPTGHFAQDVARGLVARGHRVQVLASRGRYAAAASAVESHVQAPPEEAGIALEHLGGQGTPRRGLLARVGRAAGFVVRVRRRMRRLEPRPDLVIALTSPPFLGAALGSLGVPVAHWIMDLYPDALAAHGMLRRERLPYRWLAARQRRAWREAALVLTLGQHMEARVRATCGAARLESVPLWGHAVDSAALDKQAARVALGWPPERMVLLYSGNLGAAHRCDEFLEAARQLGPAGPLWAFSGGGARRAQVVAFRAQHPQAHVEVWPYAEADVHHQRLTGADVHLASLAPHWQGIVVPSKVAAAFARGRPVLFVGPADNEVADWISASGGGWVVPPGDVSALLQAVADAGRPAERARRGAAARAFALQHFDEHRNVGRIVALLEHAAARGGPGASSSAARRA